MEDIFGYILKLKSRLDVCLSGLLVKIFIVLFFEASNDLSQKLLYHHLYTKLTVEEERVIIDKATEIPSQRSMIIFIRTEHLYVAGVTHHSFHLKGSLVSDVDGQALMKAFQMQ